MATSLIWIGFDLGVRGDYEGLYAWLDTHEAKDCGESLAYLQYNYTGSLTSSLKSDLQAAVKTDNQTRIYVIFRDKKTDRIRGRFLFGGRRVPPWRGLATIEPGAEDSCVIAALTEGETCGSR